MKPGTVFEYAKGIPDDGLPTIILIGANNTQAWYLTTSQPGHKDYPKVVRETVTRAAFDSTFVKSEDDLLSLAKLLHEYARALGIDPMARTELGRFYQPSQQSYQIEDTDMKTNDTKSSGAVKAAAKSADKLDSEIGKKTAPAAASKAKPVAPVKGKAAVTAVSATAKTADAAPKATTKPAAEKRPSVSGRFSELIMDGKMTDDEIFATVKREFNLSDDKRSYVSWNRNNLTKKGMNPPAPVGGAKAPKAAAPAPKAAAPAPKAAAPAPKAAASVGGAKAPKAKPTSKNGKSS